MVFPVRLPVARRDRDLPRPFDHPHRRPPGADRDHRQQLVRPERRPRRQIYLLRRGRARPRQHVRELHRLARPPARADARRPDAPRRSAQPRRRRRRQGPRGGDDGRPQSQPALVVGRARLRQPCRRRRAGRGAAGQCPRRPRRSRARASRCALPDVCEARSRAIAVPGRTAPRRHGRFARAAGDRTALRASPEFDVADPRSRRGACATRCGLGEGPATDLLAIGLSATDYVGHTLRHPRRRDVHPAARARPHARRLLPGARPRADRLCGRC